MVYEAHSTDYQTAEDFKALVRDHFAILKVGPALTFAMREALWALDHIEREWLGNKASNFKSEHSKSHEGKTGSLEKLLPQRRG